MSGINPEFSDHLESEFQRLELAERQRLCLHPSWLDISEMDGPPTRTCRVCGKAEALLPPKAP